MLSPGKLSLVWAPGEALGELKPSWTKPCKQVSSPKHVPSLWKPLPTQVCPQIKATSAVPRRHLPYLNTAAHWLSHPRVALAISLQAQTLLSCSACRPYYVSDWVLLPPSLIFCSWVAFHLLPGLTLFLPLDACRYTHRKCRCTGAEVGTWAMQFLMLPKNPGESENSKWGFWFMRNKFFRFFLLVWDSLMFWAHQEGSHKAGEGLVLLGPMLAQQRKAGHLASTQTHCRAGPVRNWPPALHFPRPWAASTNPGRAVGNISSP